MLLALEVTTVCYLVIVVFSRKSDTFSGSDYSLLPHRLRLDRCLQLRVHTVPSFPVCLRRSARCGGHSQTATTEDSESKNHSNLMLLQPFAIYKIVNYIICELSKQCSLQQLGICQWEIVQ